jgi:hypothetical protein
MYLEKLAARDKVKPTTGAAIFAGMLLLAVGLFLISIRQGIEFTKMMR